MPQQPASTPITLDLQLVSCRYDDPQPGQPVREAIVTLQEAQPFAVHLEMRVSDPTLAQEFVDLWKPYKEAVDARTAPLLPDGTPNPLYGQPWPEAPRRRLTLD